MTIIRNGNGDVINDENPLQVKLMDSGIILPTDNQSKLATTIQTHNAVSVPLSNVSDGAWIDCDGFNQVAVTMKNDAATNSSAEIHWSHDGITRLGVDIIVIVSTAAEKSGILETRARYAKIRLNNLDAGLAHTMNAYAYLKA